MKAMLYYAGQLHAYAGRKLYTQFVGMMAVSLLDGIGVLLLVPMLAMMGIVQLDAGALPFSAALYSLQGMPRTQGMLLILGIYVALLLGQSFVKRSLLLRDTAMHLGFVQFIRLDVYRSVLQADWSFFLKRRRSDLVHALTQELGRVANGIKLLQQFVSTFVFTGIQVGFAFWLSAQLTLLVLGFGMLSLLFSRTYIRKAGKLGSQTTALARSYAAELTEHYNGMKEIKSNMLESSRLRWLQRWNEQMVQERMAHAAVSAGSQLLYKLAAGMMIACFLFVSVAGLHAQGQPLLLVMVIFSRLWPQFTTIQAHLEQLAVGLPAFQSLLSLRQQAQQAGGAVNMADYSRVRRLQVKQGLACRSVAFRYDRQSPVYALSHIDLEIPANRMTAVVGRSGAGKSTLIDLLMGMLQPEQGEVLADGRPLTEAAKLALRRSISYVPQDPFLFHASIRDNLLLVEPHASEEQLWEALAFASADAFVRALPQGLDSWIGDRGIRLSGGERQRLVLARAMLRKPTILVLDEATSALDADNEANIQAALARLHGQVTIIVIAHRLSTIRHADQVLVLEQGRLVQQGSYAELAGQADGMFQKLLANQRLETKTRRHAIHGDFG